MPEDSVPLDTGGIGFEFAVADENSLKMEQHIIDICEAANGQNGFEAEMRRDYPSYRK